ncbi:hypothetical protein Dsin_024722 [Dipteronia sinensis]|uniref:Uncharacterized protein n=1 Tax=Dipteronia sinensis TaxID=43782 RepID=A0AAE0DWA1_9ROSI|nr:hypothetical protein Dsin_024722 [Dipteronia sinensis]
MRLTGPRLDKISFLAQVIRALESDRSAEFEALGSAKHFLAPVNSLWVDPRWGVGDMKGLKAPADGYYDAPRFLYGYSPSSDRLSSSGSCAGSPNPRPFRYDQDFPPLEPTYKLEKTRFSRPYVQSTEVLHDGSLKHPSHAEQVLNWQSHNARIQNRVLSSIDQKIDRVSHHVSQHENRLHSMDSTFREMFSDLQSRIAKLDADLRYYINLGYHGS